MNPKYELRFEYPNVVLFEDYYGLLQTIDRLNVVISDLNNDPYVKALIVAPINDLLNMKLGKSMVYIECNKMKVIVSHV